MKNILTPLLSFSRRRLRWVSLVLALVAGLGWFYYDHRFPSWDEEVMLSDGRMLVVHRKQDVIEGFGVRRTWLTFSLPEMGGEQTWTEWMYPAIVDAHEGKVYVVGLPIGRGQYYTYLQPRFLYVAYEFSGNGWTRIPFIGLPEKVRARENILWCAAKNTKLTWSFKSSGWCGDTSFSESGTPIIEISKLVAKTQYLNRLNGKTSFSE